MITESEMREKHDLTFIIGNLMELSKGLVVIPTYDPITIGLKYRLDSLCARSGFWSVVSDQLGIGNGKV